MMNRILIADNDPAMRLFYADELFEAGYEVITCGDGSILMDMIRNHLPDLILMDVRFGCEKGLDLLQNIKREYGALPVILCTAYPLFMYDLRSMPADYFVTKSSKLKELKFAIQKVIHGEQCGQPAPIHSLPDGQPSSHTKQSELPSWS